jgi:hypothetical protein
VIQQQVLQNDVLLSKGQVKRGGVLSLEVGFHDGSYDFSHIVFGIFSFWENGDQRSIFDCSEPSRENRRVECEFYEPRGREVVKKTMKVHQIEKQGLDELLVKAGSFVD